MCSSDLRKEINLNTISSVADYDLVVQIGSVITAGSFVINTKYQITSVGTTDFTSIGAERNNIGVVFIATGVGSGTGTAKKSVDVIRKIRSLRQPSTWGELHYRTDQQFDKILREQSSLSVPTYLTFRNKKLIFHSAPTIDDETIVLQVDLHTPSEAMTETVEPETEQYFDECLEIYALWFLLPLDHPMKQSKRAEYETYINDKFGKFNDNFSAPIIPKTRW